MDFLNILLAIAKPTGFWENIIFGLDNKILNYALTLIVIGVLIKLITLPIDFINKYVTKKNAITHAKIKPQLDHINKTFANNKDLLNRKTMELYKSSNYNIVGTCVFTLISMVLTLVIFLTLFSSLNKIGEYKQSQEFIAVYNTYYEAYNNAEDTLTDEEKETLAKEKVVEIYENDIRTGFLWIKNIWRPDTSTNVFPNYDQATKIKNFLEIEEGVTVSEEDYNKITGSINKEYGWNGFYIIAALSVLTTFLSIKIPYWINKAIAKRKNVAFVDQASENKILLFLMPVLMAVFTLLYNAAFGIYIVSGSLFMVLTNPAISLGVDKLIEVINRKKQNQNKVTYSRK